ncbi:MAG TPA: adenylate/guanylate cyclase domain-containing protein [Actinoplanes sp.]|nr:adenylate/guanylate cyclase domain-containing protein [Actinoplanes sp.]
MRASSYRRRVAVLFVDICGFTRLVDTTDPELVYQVVRPLMDRLVAVVRRHGGEIQQVLGDGFMAVFGLTDPRGDEARRAVRAGLALLAAADRRPAVHVGIEYGDVLVTPSFEPAEFGVWGRAVTVAQRLCDLAGPGELQVGPAAYAAAGPHAGRATPRPATLKGITHAVVAHRMMLPSSAA